MNTPNRTLAKNLQDGMLIDLRPLVDRLIKEGHVAEGEQEDLVDSVSFEYAEVEAIVFETNDDGEKVVVIYNDIVNLAVGEDWEVELNA